MCSLYKGRTRGKKIDFLALCGYESPEEEVEEKCRDCGKCINESELFVVCGQCGVSVHNGCLEDVIERTDAELSMVCDDSYFLCAECRVPWCLCGLCERRGKYDKDVWVKCANVTCGDSFHYSCLPDHVTKNIAMCESLRQKWFCTHCMN